MSTDKREKGDDPVLGHYEDQGFSGDGGSSLSASFDSLVGIALDADGNLFLVDQLNHRIRRVDAGADGQVTGAPDEIVTTVAGSGATGLNAGGFSGDSGPATSAVLNFPVGVAVDGAGHLLIADQFSHRIRRVDAGSGIISTVAGSGPPGSLPGQDVLGDFSGDDGPAASARFGAPDALALDRAGSLFLADQFNHRIRRVDAGADGQVTGAPDEVVTTVAGSGPVGVFAGGFAGDGGLATADAVRLNLRTPTSLAFDHTGSLFMTESSNERVRRVTRVPGPPTPTAQTAAILATALLWRLRQRPSGTKRLAACLADGELLPEAAGPSRPSAGPPAS